MVMQIVVVLVVLLLLVVVRVMVGLVMQGGSSYTQLPPPANKGISLD